MIVVVMVGQAGEAAILDLTTRVDSQGCRTVQPNLHALACESYPGSADRYHLALPNSGDNAAGLHMTAWAAYQLSHNRAG